MTHGDVRSGPLSGVRVLSIENYLAGNAASYLLSLFGAEIIKIEQPGVGDALRSAAGKVGHGDNKQQNKLSVAIDLSKPEGRKLLMGMVPNVDIVFSNQKPSTLKKMGVSFEALQERNPRIIYTTLSGFGHDDLVPSGPFGNWAAFDVIAQGLAGLQYRCMPQRHLPEDTPGYNGIPLGDDGTAVNAVLGSVLALLQRDRTGEPQRVDVAMHDAMVYYNGSSLARWRGLGTEAPRAKSVGGSAPYGAYRTADGWVNIAVYGEPIWRNFCRAIERPEAIDDPRFDGASSRLANLEALDTELVKPFCESRSTSEVLEILQPGGVPVAPIFNIKDVAESPQVAARKLLVDAFDERGEIYQVLGSPIKVTGLSYDPLRPSPRLGQHTGACLQQLAGVEDAALDELEAAGVIQRD